MEETRAKGKDATRTKEKTRHRGTSGMGNQVSVRDRPTDVLKKSFAELDDGGTHL